MILPRKLVSTALLLLFFSLRQSYSQTHNYWTRSFNEESSLLSGAVVGGGSGPSAIYYNPASISEVKASKFSLNASLFSFNFIEIKNALGNGIDIGSSIAKVEPRFISYMLKPPKHQKWSFEVAILNNENDRVEITTAVDEKMNILTDSPGDDRYTAFYQYQSKFRDDWIGIGSSVHLSQRMIVGVSMFACIKTLSYSNSIDIQAYPLGDSLQNGGGALNFYAAGYEENYFLRFNDYRLLWKAGLLYKWKNISAGLTITTPSIGIYSDGKRVQRKQQQTNITDPATGAPMPDYLVTDYQEKGNVTAGYKTPLSIAVGLTWEFKEGRRVLFLSAEYFNGIQPYRMVYAEESPLLTTENVPVGADDWLSWVNGAKPVCNIAVGYNWTLNDKLMLKAGFRTDFNYQKNFDFGQLSDLARIRTINLDLYYLTCGVSWEIFGQDIITGIQYSHGHSGGQKQAINLSDPVEFNHTEQKALQGTRTNQMTSDYNSFIIYLGFSLNFGEKKTK